MIANVLRYKGYVVGPIVAPGVNAVLSSTAVEHWSHPTDPQPTEQQLTAWQAEPGFSAWLAEHGGDSVMTLRRNAHVCLDDANDAQNALIRALALVVLDENNLLRQWVTSFKSAVAAATSLADLKTRVAALENMPDRTAVQLRNAITQQISNGNADS